MNQTMPSAKQFLYEPAKYGPRIIKKWEEKTGQYWYNLSPNSRKQANTDLELLKVSMKQELNNSNSTANLLNISLELKNHRVKGGKFNM